MARQKFFILFLSFLLYDVLAQNTYYNPVVDNNRPDPGVLRLPDGEGFVAVTTSNYADDSQPAFPIMFSSDLVNWEEVGHVFSAGAWPAWAYTDMWAPEIHLVDGNFHVYFSGRTVDDDRLAIGMAVSTNSSSYLGPYADYGQPILQDDRGVIDIHWFRDPVSSLPYLVWKTDDNAVGEMSRIYLQRVEEDGHTLVEGTQPTEIMVADQPEDYNVVEGPWIFYRSPYYYLAFSSDGFQSVNYHVNVARSSSVEGPYERYGGEQFLHTDTCGGDCPFVGPGHGSVVKLDNDDWWYVYHSWRGGLVGVDPPGRTLCLDRITWQDDGWPVVGVPSDYVTEAPNV